MSHSTNNSKRRIIKIESHDVSRPIEFDLQKLVRDGKLKSKLVKFDNKMYVRVYWNSRYDGEPVKQEGEQDG